MKLIDTTSPFYKLPFGCGTIAIWNLIFYQKKETFHNEKVMDNISKCIKEHNFTTKSCNIGNALKKYDLTYSHIIDIDLNQIKKHLSLGKQLILLSFEEDNLVSGVGHYSFIYGSHKMAYSTNKLFCDVDIINQLSIKNKNHRPQAWLID